MNRVRPLFRALLVLLLLGAVLVGWSLWPTSEATWVARAVAMGRLGSLPEGARDLRAAGTDGMFSRSAFVRFAADETVIDAFLDAAPGLLGVESTPWSGHLPTPYPWFAPNPMHPGRSWEIPQDANACWGRVYVDDKQHVVYIEAHRS